MSLKLVVIGHKSHGKGAFAKIAEQHFELTAMGTSRYMAQIMFDKLKDRFGYTSVAQCHDDRNNHRELWFQELNDFCGDTPSRLIEEILARYDICEGPRNRIEFDAAKKRNALGNLVIFIDASERMPLEGAGSMQLTKADAHIVIENNGTEAEFEAKCIALLGLLVRSDLYDML